MSPRERIDVGPEVLEAAIERLIAVAGASRRRQQQLQRALDSRVVIEQAKGVLAERLGITPTAAFERLRAEARPARRKVADLAAEVVASVSPAA